MLYAIEFIKQSPGRPEPYVVDKMTGDFRDDAEAVGQAKARFTDAHVRSHAEGFRVLENETREVRTWWIDWLDV